MSSINSRESDELCFCRLLFKEKKKGRAKGRKQLDLFVIFCYRDRFSVRLL